MAEYLKAGFLHHLVGELFKILHGRIYDGSTTCAYDMGVRIGLVPIITIPHFTELQFKHFSILFEKIEGFIYRSQTHGRVLRNELLVYSFSRRMIIASGEYLQDSVPLGSDTMIILLEAMYHLFQALIWRYVRYHSA